jgi:hypothetical protein
MTLSKYRKVLATFSFAFALTVILRLFNVIKVEMEYIMIFYLPLAAFSFTLDWIAEKQDKNRQRDH